MSGLLQLPGTVFRAFSFKAAPEVERAEGSDPRRASSLEAEHACLVERIAQLQDAIRVLDTAPGNRTGQAMVERYRANERRLAAECRRLERELAKGAQHGELAVP